MIYTYKGKPPKIEQVVKKHGLNPQRVLYLTATARLQNVRQDELKSLDYMINPKGGGEDKQLCTLFRKALISILSSQGHEVLTRNAERILFRRSIDKAYQRLNPTDLEAKREQIIADEQRWLEAFERICAAQGHLNTLPFITDSLRASCTALWSAFSDKRQETAQGGEVHEFFPETLLKRASHLTSHDVELIIFEGFTFFTPLQAALIKTLQAQGKVQLLFVINYDSATPAAYQSVVDVYQHVLGEDITDEACVIPTDPLDQHSILRDVRGQLFEPHVQPVSQPQNQQVVSFSWHALQNDEARACVDWIQRHRPDLLLPASKESRGHQEQRLTKLVVISRDVQEAKLAIEMECTRRGVKSPFRHERFSLLHLPIGRFLLLAYQVMRTGSFLCDPESFAIVVDSGLLNAQVGDRNHLVYQRLLPLYFENCRTEQEWEDAFQALLTGAHPNPSDLQPSTAASVVDQTKRQELYDLYLQFKGLAQALFTSQEGAVTDHAERLKVYLEQYLTPNLTQATTNDRDVIQDIQTILEELPDELKVTSDEFHGLLMGYLQDEQEDEEVSDAYLSLVGPESAEGTQVDHVWVFGAQQATFPRRYDYPWPFDDLSIDDHIHRERNFWMAVLRHPRKTLTLSVTHLYDEEARIFSPYVNEVANRLGLGLEEPVMTLQALSNAPALVHMPSTSEDYSLVEIARYRLCPFAYYALKNDPLGKTAAGSFQVSWRAQAWWIEQAFDELVALGNLRQHLGLPHQLLHQLRLQFDRITLLVNQRFDQTFPGMSSQFRDDLKQRSMSSFERFLFGDKYSIREAYLGSLRPIRLVVNAPTSRVLNQKTIYIPKRYVLMNGQYPIERADPSLHFNVPASFGTYGAEPDPSIPAVSLQVTPNTAQTHMSSQYEAMRWFTRAALLWFDRNPHVGPHWLQVKVQEVHQEVNQRVAEIERGYFPKNPGEHCVHCPAAAVCQSAGELREEHR